MTIEEYIRKFNEFFNINGYSDSLSIEQDEAYFSHHGCDCCNFISENSNHLAADVYDCTDIHGNEFKLCGQCLVAAINCDFSFLALYIDGRGELTIV